MELMAHFIFLTCLFSGLWNVIYFFRQSRSNALKYYVLAKGLAILYLGVGYGLVGMDYWVDIMDYPGGDSLMVISIPRVAAATTTLIFLTDCFMRDRQ